MIVPGSGLVKEQAEKEGLDKIYNGLIDLDPICLEIYHKDTDLNGIDSDSKYF